MRECLLQARLFNDSFLVATESEAISTKRTPYDTSKRSTSTSSTRGQQRHHCSSAAIMPLVALASGIHGIGQLTDSTNHCTDLSLSGWPTCLRPASMMHLRIATGVRLACILPVRPDLAGPRSIHAIPSTHCHPLLSYHAAQMGWVAVECNRAYRLPARGKRTPMQST